MPVTGYIPEGRFNKCAQHNEDERIRLGKFKLMKIAASASFGYRRYFIFGCNGEISPSFALPITAGRGVNPGRFANPFIHGHIREWFPQDAIVDSP